MQIQELERELVRVYESIPESTGLAVSAAKSVLGTLAATIKLRDQNDYLERLAIAVGHLAKTFADEIHSAKVGRNTLN